MEKKKKKEKSIFMKIKNTPIIKKTYKKNTKNEKFNLEEKETFIKNYRKTTTVGNFFNEEIEKVLIFLKRNEINDALESLKIISELKLKQNEFEKYISTLMNLYRINENSKLSQLEFIYHIIRNKSKNRHFVILNFFFSN